MDVDMILARVRFDSIPIDDSRRLSFPKLARQYVKVQLAYDRNFEAMHFEYWTNGRTTRHKRLTDKEKALYRLAMKLRAKLGLNKYPCPHREAVKSLAPFEARGLHAKYWIQNKKAQGKNFMPRA